MSYIGWSIWLTCGIGSCVDCTFGLASGVGKVEEGELVTAHWRSVVGTLIRSFRD